MLDDSETLMLIEETKGMAPSILQFLTNVIEAKLQTAVERETESAKREEMVATLRGEPPGRGVAHDVALCSKHTGRFFFLYFGSL